MRQSFLPSTDDGLLFWATNLANQIEVDPSEWGLSPEQTADFRELVESYRESLRRCSPNIRNRVSVSGKNAAREAVKNAARILVAIIRVQPNLTDAQKIGLGLTIPAARRAAVPPPDHAPQVHILAVRGRTVSIRLLDTSAMRRGRPVGVKSAVVMTFVGEVPSPSLSDWKLAMNTTKTMLDIGFDTSIPAGGKVWLAAYWLNNRAEAGPASDAISTSLQGGMLADRITFRMAA